MSYLDLYSTGYRHKGSVQHNITSNSTTQKYIKLGFFLGVKKYIKPAAHLVSTRQL
jgi:hypothetical protein